MDERSVLRSRVIVTSKNRLLYDYTPWEPFTRLAKAGQLDLEEAPTLGEILAGERVGRQSDDEIILMASPGIGFCDVAVAKWVYDLALKADAGLRLPHDDAHWPHQQLH
jgi:ornithine cyclodeaminase/alanine dehydrogenase-like protein (mu-crystallin family)